MSCRTADGKWDSEMLSKGIDIAADNAMSSVLGFTKQTSNNTWSNRDGKWSAQDDRRIHRTARGSTKVRTGNALHLIHTIGQMPGGNDILPMLSFNYNMCDEDTVREKMAHYGCGMQIFDRRLRATGIPKQIQPYRSWEGWSWNPSNRGWGSQSSWTTAPDGNQSKYKQQRLDEGGRGQGWTSGSWRHSGASSSTTRTWNHGEAGTGQQPQYGNTTPTYWGQYGKRPTTWYEGPSPKYARGHYGSS